MLPMSSLTRWTMPVGLALMLASPAVGQERQAESGAGAISFIDDGRSYAEFGIGAFNILKKRNGGTLSAVGNLEYRHGQKLFSIGPALGVLTNSEGAVYGYGGLYADIVIGDVVITPLAGFGGYDRNGSKDLGGVFQFRLSLSAAYEFHNGHRLGAKFAHLSNAFLHDINPGEEEVLLTYSIPFGGASR